MATDRLLPENRHDGQVTADNEDRELRSEGQGHFRTASRQQKQRSTALSASETLGFVSDNRRLRECCNGSATGQTDSTRDNRLG